MGTILKYKESCTSPLNLAWFVKKNTEDFVTKDVIEEAVRLSDGTPYQDIISDLGVMAYVMALRQAEAAGPTAIHLSQLTIHYR